jgi:alkanesulfonate monooxygenase SsuD/methylene tetrahydromethanopterin reductase-like flavin-dependent oxidoreductase (luciferase family)
MPEKAVFRVDLIARIVAAETNPKIHSGLPMRVAVARNIFVARDATEKHAAVTRQAQIHDRLLSLSRGSESRPGAHILGYADTPEAHLLIGTAGEVEAGLAALKEVGVAYVLLFGQGSRDNLRRFAERVMPKFSCPSARVLSPSPISG